MADEDSNASGSKQAAGTAASRTATNVTINLPPAAPTNTRATEAPAAAASTPTSRRGSRQARAGGARSGRRRRPQEFLMPDGRRVLVALPEDAQALRSKYAAVNAARDEEEGGGSGGGGAQVEVVVHGSAEHQRYLQESRDHQQARREALKAKHGADFFNEWDQVTADLDQVSAELERLADHSASLGHSFSKFGFNAQLRTFGDSGKGDERRGSASASASRRQSRANSINTLTDTEAGGDDGGGDDDDYDDDDGDDGGGKTGHTSDEAQGMRLFQRPVVKQYFHRGLLWRASEETEVQSFELFFDLMYVGILAVNGDHAAESADGFELLRFVVTFCLSWKIWADVTQLVSWFETNDVASRVQILFLFACLLGVTINMAQTFGTWGSGGEEATTESGGAAETTAELAARVASNWSQLLRREGETDTGGASSESEGETAGGDTYPALAAFYVTARLFIALYCAVTAYLVPLVQGTMVCQVVIAVVGAALWIASIHLAMPVRLACVFVALVFDLFGGSLVVGAFRYATTHATSRVGRALLQGFFDFFPAINIEHKVERINAFVSLVLGYSVVGILFQNSHGYAMHAFLGKAVLGLVQAFLFNWLYFDVDGANIRVHAIRRGAEANFVWHNAHLLFALAFTLSSAALSRLVVAHDTANAPVATLTDTFAERSAAHVSLGHRLYYSAGLGVALFAMTLIAASHTHKTAPDCRLPKWARMANRLAVAAVFCALPAAQSLTSLQLVSVATGLVVWVLVVELYGTSGRGDPLFRSGRKGAGEGGQKYTARCSARRLREALRQGKEQPGDGEQPEIDVHVLSRGEKHGGVSLE